VTSEGPQKGTCLEIGPYGLKTSERENKDGYTYFGTKEANDKENRNVSILLVVLENSTYL